MLVVVMAFSFAIPTAAALIDDLNYTVNGDEVTITGYNGFASGSLEIPSVIDGRPVTAIGVTPFVVRI